MTKIYFTSVLSMRCMISLKHKLCTARSVMEEKPTAKKREELKTSIVKKLWKMEARINTARFIAATSSKG